MSLFLRIPRPPAHGRPTRAVLALLVLFGAAVIVAPRARSGAAQDLPVGIENAVDAARVDPEAWAQMLEFDALVGFPQEPSFDAGLVRKGDTPSERAAAIYALARSSNPAARQVLAGLLGRARGIEEIATIYGLAELRPLPVELLLDVGRLNDVNHVAHVAVALVLSEVDAAQRAVLRMQYPGTPLGEIIADARRFASDRTTARGLAPIGDWLELRRQAAMRFGRVDDEPWRARRLRELEGDQAWLSRLVVPLGASVDRPWIRDHLLAALLADPNATVFEACVESMGEPLVRLVESGLWKPSSQARWNALLDAVEESDRTAGFAGVMQRALRADVPEDVRLRAACILFAVGLAEASDAVVRDLLDSDDVERVALALRAVSDSPAVASLAVFEPYLDPEVDPKLRAVALVGVLVRAPSQVSDRVREGLVADEDLREPLVRELLRRSRSVALTSALLLASTLPELPEELLLDVHAVLALRDVGKSGAALGTALARGADGPVAARALEALEVLSPIVAQEAAVDALLFGRDDAFTLTAGRLLITSRHPIGISLLRRAVWIRDVPVSQLAAGYLVHQEGTSALEREADAPPSWARDDDLRRLGLALGEWGGYGVVQQLARSRNVRDPVLQGAYLGALASRTR